MNDDGSTTYHYLASPVRRSQRMELNASVQLAVRGCTYDVTLRNISRFGAFVSDLPRITRGTSVELRIGLEGASDLVIPGSVAYWIDDARAARLGSAPGAGLQFGDPIEDDDTTFGAAITCLLVRQSLGPAPKPSRRRDKSTERLPAPVRDALVSVMNLETEESRGRLIFAGLIAVIRVPDVLTTLALLRISGRLELTCGGVVANVDLHGGDIVGVRSSNDTGDPCEVLRTLFASRTGSFRFLTHTPCVRQFAGMKVSRLLMNLRPARAEVRVSDV